MEKGIKKLKRILAGEKETPFTSREYMTLFTELSTTCAVKKAPHDYSEQLYDKYKETLDEYITSIVLPSLKDKHDEFMLRELVKKWLNHKIMVKWLTRFFYYLDRYFIFQRSVPALNEVGMTCFLNLVYEDMHPTFKDIVLSLIDKEREGEQTDRALLKNALDIFVEMGLGKMNRYQDDFEAPFLQETTNYYSRKASKWIEEYSCLDYVLKSEECLKKEGDKVSNYLHSSTETKLIEKVQHELLVVYVNQLLEKEDSGIKVLFRDDKVDDLSRIYRVYYNISQGLDLVANTFKKHVTIEGTAFVQQAEEAASNQASNTPGGHEQVLVKNILGLHDKYMTYLNSCFQNHDLFHKALKESFDVFCNKTVNGSPIAEILASFADHILRKGGTEKLSDEVIEETFEKLVNLLQYVIDKDVFAEFYRKKLARRLLFDRGTNDDHEKSILSKLKQQFGAPLTSKMEGMITDVVLAKENQGSFQEYLRHNPDVHPGLDFTVTVLTTGSWPSYKSFDLALPSEMVPLPPMDERKKVVEDVDKDRPYAIDAAIVRIMKSKKVTSHQQLISETVEQLSHLFKPNIRAIKKRMEDLITRDHMERDPDNSHMFRFLA